MPCLQRFGVPNSRSSLELEFSQGWELTVVAVLSPSSKSAKSKSVKPKAAKPAAAGRASRGVTPPDLPIFDGFVGIDVDKPDLEICLGGATATFRQDNTAAGIDGLIKRLKALPVAVRLVVLEATGGYENKLLEALLVAEVPVARVNPQRPKAFAKSRGVNAKTDEIDARILADFARVNEDSLHHAAAVSENMKMLRSLVARRRQLVQQCVINQNQREHATLAPVKQSIDRMVKVLREEALAIEVQIQAAINSDAALLARQEKLETVPGIGKRVARLIVSEMPELGIIGRAQAAALVGVAPFNDDSGKRSGVRSIKGGRCTVRAGIYMATLVATRHNPVIKAHYEHLKSRGKPKKVALVACMRKMINYLTVLLAEPELS